MESRCCSGLPQYAGEATEILTPDATLARTRGERNLLNYNGSPGGEDLFFSPGTFINEFYRIDGFGPDQEDVCVYNAPDFLPGNESSDVVVFVRRGLPTSQITDGLLAIALRADEGLEEAD